jgi:hypothetical protein
MIAATFDPIVARYILNKPEKAFPFFACAPSGAESSTPRAFVADAEIAGIAWVSALWPNANSAGCFDFFALSRECRE